MCGITGLLYFSQDRLVESSVLKKMTDSIFHRGPDDEGYFTNRNIGLGFRRLSIIDLSTGHQPMPNNNSSIHIVFNGEIYNYKEQRELLVKKGYQFNTQTDTEVILHLYEEYGIDCLQFLRGMFAFAIWDNNTQQLFCARDRFGIKPFYYYADNKKFVFGSEIKAILHCGDIDKTISYDALDSYFAFGSISSDLSIYKGIKKLQPGHYLLLSIRDKASIKIQRYWDIQFEPDFSKSEKQWTEEIENCLSETVKLHMISDVPLGAFLSGGIDSSSIVAMMAKNSNMPIKTFSIGFKEQKYNELVYAREMAERYGCEYHEQIIEPESISLLPKLVAAYDEPFADSSAIPTYYVSKLARENVTVALSGDAGDELFAGYSIYNYLNGIHSSPLSFNNPYLNKLIWGNINKLIPSGVKGKGITYFLSKEKESIGAYLNYWTKEERQKLFLANRFQDIDYSASEHYKKELLRNVKSTDFISKLQYLDMKTYMVDGILTKVDRASMMNSLEVRVPLLDHVFAELIFKIPWNLKYNGQIQKYIFKKAMAGYLPDNVSKHPKQGFEVPLNLWFKDDLKEYVFDTLLSNNTRLSSFVDMKIVKKYVGSNYPGMRDFSKRTWLLLFFEEWLKQNEGI
jgi:asparagine synthase (glutamine-hydrolysing)